MAGRVEVSDAEIVDAVGAVEGEMLELLSRLVEARRHLETRSRARRSWLRHSATSSGWGERRVIGMSDTGMGTLYTAVYKPGGPGSVEYRWPGVAWEHSFERFREGGRTSRLMESTAA